MIKRLFRKFSLAIIEWASEKTPDFIIGGRANPYLIRWWLIPRNRFLNIYVHFIRRSDDDRALHDHPFYNVSILLFGSYLEHTKKGVFVRKEGNIVFRRGVTLHRLEINDGPCWSLFITGPRYRTWGFACPKGWIPWQRFVDARDKGSVGRGCD